MSERAASMWPFDWLAPDWPAPQNVHACVTTRNGGESSGPFAGFNLGAHVGDSLDDVQANRAYLADALQCQPTWLDQVHGHRVVTADAEQRSEEHTSELQSRPHLVCRLLLEKKNS